MEGYSHSHSHSHFRSHSKQSTLSVNKKLPPFPPHTGNNGGFFTSYDDVFGGPPKFSGAGSSLAPRAEDYSEIFGGFRSSSSSRASSIPVLDLPSVANSDVSASIFDYAEVFGGFDAVDFAVPYDELFQPFDGGDGSSDEAWTPVGTESLSDDSDPFAFSEKTQSFLNENSHQPVDSKQFNVSYHKVNVGANTYMPNMTHVAQLNAIPAYTYVVDEATSLGETGDEKFCAPVVDEIALMSHKHTTKTMSHLKHDSAGLKSFDGDRKSGRARTASMSQVNSTFSSVNDIDIRKEPSHLPPPSRPLPPELAERKVAFSTSTSGPKGSKASENYGAEATVDDSLPPFFDMEVNSSSSAAVSMAAMKDVMEKAQVKLKAAKELMDRKKDGLHNIGKLGLKADVNGGEKANKASDECVSKDERVPATSDRGVAKMKSSSKDGHVTNSSAILPDFSSVEHQTGVIGKLTERNHKKKSGSPMDTGGTGEWKEATQYFEFVNNDNTRLAPQTLSNDVDEDNSDSTGDACVPEENRRRLKVTKAVSRQEYYEKMIKVAQEVHDRVVGGKAECEKELKSMPQGNKKEKKPKSGHVMEMNERKPCQAQQPEEGRPGEAIRINEAEIRSQKSLENEEIKKKETEACHLVNEVLERKEEERMRGPCIREESERRVRGNVVIEENEERVKEACERQRLENTLAEGLKHKRHKEKREVKEKRSKEALDKGFGGERSQAVYDGKDIDVRRDLQAEDKRSREAQTTGESRENDEAKDLHKRGEYENLVEKVVDCLGPENILEEVVELEMCRKFKEALEQEKSWEFLGEAQELVADNKELEEKLEKPTETEEVENESMQADEPEKSGKIPDNTSDMEDQKGVSDQGRDSSPEVELPMHDEHPKSSDVANLDDKDVERDMLSFKHEIPQMKADGSQEMSACKDNGEINTVPSDEGRELEAVVTTDILGDERPIESAAAQVGANDNEHERRTVHVLETPHFNDNNTEMNGIFTRNGQTLKEDSERVARQVFDSKLVKDFNHEQGEIRNLEEVQVRFTLAEDIDGLNNQLSKKDGAHRRAIPERNESIRKRSQPHHISQSTERKGKIMNQSSSSEEKDKEKEREEEEQLRKLEEEREREREREKDRMAVEVAIREARERAYVDARDRAERAAVERATDEARQRAMAEARERLEKACIEARERSLADKSTEARLRAERAAVERATTEARQRAFEKAMAERATIEARERYQRSVSDKYSSERHVVMRQSSMPSNTEKLETVDSEPAQRCKARLERHRRTVERVANALAEKNMRDLLAQREQAERNRFAETLDADIKRWSNGKEGNLRALLSTLQYILGADSGWQPIPLTEVITAAAVKKAYRKATLCVHPDKLQQRGASVQHKYICEKVFDLLKEAWNRFNSEEK